MTTTTEAQIDTQIEHGVAWLTLSNSKKLNAISLPMWLSLSELLDKFERDPAIRCIVLRGQGEKAFCAGADISQFEAIRSGADASAEYESVTRETLMKLRVFPKPTIAVISGFCLGAGVALATACDLRIASTTARVGIPAAKLGIAYFYAVVKQLTDLIGASASKRMIFTADKFSSEEMMRLGFFDELVEPGELIGRAQSFSAQIAANAPLTISAAKYAIATACSDAVLRDIAGCEQRARACVESEDHKEGQRAFKEKRQPVFHGR